MERWTLSKLEAVVLFGLPILLIGGVAALILLLINALFSGVVASVLSVLVIIVATVIATLKIGWTLFWVEIE